MSENSTALVGPASCQVHVKFNSNLRGVQRELQRPDRDAIDSTQKVYLDNRYLIISRNIAQRLRLLCHVKLAAPAISESMDGENEAVVWRCMDYY